MLHALFTAFSNAFLVKTTTNKASETDDCQQGAMKRDNLINDDESVWFKWYGHKAQEILLWFDKIDSCFESDMCHLQLNEIVSTTHFDLMI